MNSYIPFALFAENSTSMSPARINAATRSPANFEIPGARR
jgi:hypothetical protein